MKIYQDIDNGNLVIDGEGDLIVTEFGLQVEGLKAEIKNFLIFETINQASKTLE